MESNHEKIYWPTSRNKHIIEIKFSKNPITLSVADEVENKINRLRYPKGFSIRPVLVHISTASESLLESEFFHYIIDFTETLK